LSLDFKEKNRKAKKLLSYFYARKKLFYETVKTARIVPFCRVSSILSPQMSLLARRRGITRRRLNFAIFGIGKQRARCLVAFTSSQSASPSIKERDARDLNRRDRCLKILSAHRF